MRVCCHKHPLVSRAMYAKFSRNTTFANYEEGICSRMFIVDPPLINYFSRGRCRTAVVRPPNQLETTVFKNLVDEKCLCKNASTCLMWNTATVPGSGTNRLQRVLYFREALEYFRILSSFQLNSLSSVKTGYRTEIRGVNGWVLLPIIASQCMTTTFLGARNLKIFRRVQVCSGFYPSALPQLFEC